MESIVCYMELADGFAPDMFNIGNRNRRDPEPMIVADDWARAAYFLAK